MFKNLPNNKYLNYALRGFIPLFVLTLLSSVTVNFLLSKSKNSVQKPATVTVNMKPKKTFGFGLGKVLGIAEYGGAGYIDIMGPSDNLFTPLPMPSVPANSIFRHPTYQNRTPVYKASWGDTIGCDIDKIECKGWTWKFVCDVDPNISWMTDKDPDWTSEEEARLYNRHCTFYSNGNGITNPILSRPESSSQVYNINDVPCGKLVQIDVTKENCMPDGPSCPYDSPTLDYIIYYTGRCSEPIVTPTPTPPLATVSCKSLTGVAKGVDNNTYQLSNLPENFEGTLKLVCIGEATVKPVTSMEFTLSKTLNGNTTSTVIILNSGEISQVEDSACSSGALCYRGEAVFNIAGQGSYSARSKVCNSDDLCSP